MPEQLHTPRPAPNRARPVPAGSVGIGGLQTGVYPLGNAGWLAVDRHTSLSLFDRVRTNRSYYVL
ncbi:carboxyltransferase domain-containing protein [Shigella flexneri]